MDILQGISSLGLPSWLVIIAAIFVILKQVGLLDFIISRLRDNSEFNQAQEEARTAAEQSEQVALWSQMTKLQSQALQQNELLLEFIIDTSKTWNQKHESCLNEVLERQQAIIYELRQLAAKFTIMVSIVEQNYTRKVGDANA
jgi:hypothetical protein